ncbi:MAG TPA: molybdopterin-dependent oxidoreductase [Candidatus Acidoferrales bacterium]|nr:molybdopterin-dependent oxidoreductase [Candidatus Acidoferrales bacterium]
MKRALFLASSFSALAGCAQATNALNESPFHNVLELTERLNHLVIGTRGMARLYTEADIDWNFRTNSFSTPSDDRYTRLVNDGFRSYRLLVDGEVKAKSVYSIAELRALQYLAQITRHDCVEGWSAIGKWGGVPLHTVLSLAQPTPAARCVVFYCFDRADDGTPYYESLDLHEAMHPQTVLALDLNNHPLDPDHGAPVRLRVPTQLGYKSAKWVHHIELVAALDHIYDGKGGYWEDQGYEWYAGI